MQCNYAIASGWLYIKKDEKSKRWPNLPTCESMQESIEQFLNIEHHIEKVVNFKILPKTLVGLLESGFLGSTKS